MKIRFAFLLALPLTMFVFSGEGLACSCFTPSTYEAFRGSAAVFVGTPVSVREDTEYVKVYPLSSDGAPGSAIVRPVDIRIYTFEVEDNYKGRSPDRVEVTTGKGGGDCGYGFQIGKKYLVFAHQAENKVLSTSICSRTRSMDEAQEELETLNELTSAIDETRLFGIVSQWRSNFEKSEMMGGMSGATVVAKGKTGSFETTTDDQGRFRFIGLPYDDYTVAVAVPHGTIKYSSREIELNKDNPGVELRFEASLDAHITGRIFDFEGHPTYTAVSLVRVEIKDGQISLKQKLMSSKADGNSYEFEGVPPGQYVMGVNILDGPSVDSPYTKIFYPQTSDLNNATIIEAKEGEQQTFDLDLFPSLPLRTFKGTVVRADGKLRERVTVQLYDMDSPEGVFCANHVSVDREGRFEIKGFADHKYSLHAYEVLYEDPMHSELVTVPTDGDVTSIKLILSKPGDEADLPKSDKEKDDPSRPALKSS